MSSQINGDNKIRVLLADDHVVVREGTRELLQREADIEVVGEASDGEEAVGLVTRLKPDIVIMDIAMPKLNGIEATRQLKKRHSATAVLILTAYDTDQYVMALLEAGAAGYLLKNVRGNQLVQAIHDVYTGESVLQLSTAKRVIDQLVLKIAQKEEIPTADSVTKRELEILKLAAKGISNKDIADNLDLSVRTIQTHLSNIFKKLNAASRTEAILYGLKRNWLTMEDLP